MRIRIRKIDVLCFRIRLWFIFSHLKIPVNDSSHVQVVYCTDDFCPVEPGSLLVQVTIGETSDLKDKVAEHILAVMKLVGWLLLLLRFITKTNS